MITREDVIFYTNEEKGVVVAKLKHPIIFVDKVAEIFRKYKTLKNPLITRDLEINKYLDKVRCLRFEGKAKCNMEKDTFDLETGKKIAFLRLKNKCIHCVATAMSKWKEDIEKDRVSFEKDLNYFFTTYAKTAIDIAAY